MTKTKIVISLSIILVTIVAVVSTYLYPIQSVLSEIPKTEEDQQKNNALGIAQKFVVTTPTFEFDGNINTLDTLVIDKLKSFPNRYFVKFGFESTYDGYGNRANQMVNKVITPHTIEIIVSEGEVVSAITDGVWDEINKQSIFKNSKLPSSNKPASNFEEHVIDYHSLVKALQSRGLEVQYIKEIDDSMFTVPTKVISVAKTEIQVYEFDSELSTKAAKDTVSYDGTQIGLNSIKWMDAPHFYNQGEIIVQYIGHNPEILNLLDSFLGKQFAGM